MDKRFLDKFCPRFTGHMHYRLVDVSTIKDYMLNVRVSLYLKPQSL